MYGHVYVTTICSSAHSFQFSLTLPFELISLELQCHVLRVLAQGQRKTSTLRGVFQFYKSTSAGVERDKKYLPVEVELDDCL